MNQSIKPIRIYLRQSEKNRKEPITLNDLQNIKMENWKILNEIISNTKNKWKDLSEKLVINNTTVAEKQKVSENLNKYFTNIGPNLASIIPKEQRSFEKYLANCNTVMNDAPLTSEEVRNVFYSLKTNKSPGHDDTSFNAINVFDFIVEPLRYIFSNFLAQ